jgi:cyclopropane-fatty-acyl-phospholipid synthase
MFLSPSELTLGKAYIFDALDVEGDIEAAFDLADYLLGRDISLPSSLHLARLLRKLPAVRQPRNGRPPATLRGSVHSNDRDSQAISYHYDLAPEFFKLRLDQRMVYSCAYFTSGEETDLDTTQQRKLDYICRKLRLRQGDRLLDIGCGGGALVIHAAAHYGVRAVGITLSVPQAQVARQRIQNLA